MTAFSIPDLPRGTLEHWNDLVPEDATASILPCCGSHAWAAALVAARPVSNLKTLLALSDAIWSALSPQDWQQAFDSHPRLGETHARAATRVSLAWSQQEQSHTQSNKAASEALHEANVRYEQRFGRIFLLCADGRSTAEMLAQLERRMQHDQAAEWREAGEQQRQITRLRLMRWLESA